MKKLICAALVSVMALSGCGDKKEPFAVIPSPVFDAKPEYVDLYWVAWEQAKAKIVDSN